RADGRFPVPGIAVGVLGAHPERTGLDQDRALGAGADLGDRRGPGVPAGTGLSPSRGLVPGTGLVLGTGLSPSAGLPTVVGVPVDAGLPGRPGSPRQRRDVDLGRRGTARGGGRGWGVVGDHSLSVGGTDRPLRKRSSGCPAPLAPVMLVT